MSPRGTMRPYLLSLVLLLAATPTVPLVSAICISRFEKSESKSEAHGAAAATAGGSAKTLSLDQYGLPKKVVEKPKEVNPYETATPAKKASTAYDKPVEEDKEPSAPKKVTKEKSDDSDVSTAYLKKEKKKFVAFDVPASPKKEKKEKSDESSSSKKKKDKSDVLSPKKEKKQMKSDDSEEASPAAKKEKKEAEKKKKALKADASAYFKKEKKALKDKKKGKSNDSSEDEDAAPVDVSTTGEYVSPSEAKAEEETTPAGASSVPAELAPAEKAYAAEFASQKSQLPMGGAPDELPPSTKQSSTAAASSSQQPIMGGSPDELPPSSTKSSGDPYAAGGVPPEPKEKPKLSMETFKGMIKKPFAHMLSPETKRVCGDTQYPADCEESIAELPDGEVKPAADPVGVLRLAMEAVREKAIVALNAATDRMNAAGIEQVVKEALNDCTKSYMDIKAVLDLVDEALKRGDLATARTNLDSVETDLTTCDDGFNERGTPSVMTDHDQELQKLASDLIAIGANSIH